MEDTQIWFDGVYMRLLQSAAETGGTVSVMEQWLPPDWSPPRHVHQREDQVLYVLEGDITARLGEGAPVQLSVGRTLFLPRHQPHVFLSGKDGAKLLEINLPCGFEQFHIEAGDPATEARIPDPVPHDITHLEKAMEGYGCRIVGPPMTPDDR